jgi:hypothetical protein
MLAVFGACQRTNAEYVQLLEGSGFRVTGQVITPSGMTIIEATPSGGLPHFSDRYGGAKLSIQARRNEKGLSAVTNASARSV